MKHHEPGTCPCDACSYARLQMNVKGMAGLLIIAGLFAAWMGWI